MFRHNGYIRMLLYDMLYLGTKQWRESSQCLPSIPAILMIDNEATVQIARMANTRTKLATTNDASTSSVKVNKTVAIHQLHWIPCHSQFANILTKTQLSGKIDPHLTKIFCVLPDHMISTPTSGPQI
jgi:hypothetical protein